VKKISDRLHELRSTQHGFTLLELLIGIVIVSILMATAAQYFFHQRRKGWEAQVRASARHMAGAENYFVFNEGAPAFTDDLDDLYQIGYRWDDGSVRPYVALATNQTYCVQVHSAHDPSIVWHFSSTVGYPQKGPATPTDCGDPEVLGTYIAGLPPASAGRDGVPSDVAAGTTIASNGGSGGGSGVPGDVDGDGYPDEDGTDMGGTGGGGTDGSGTTGSGPSGGDASSVDGTTTGSVPGYGTTDPTSGTVPGSGSGGTTGTGTTGTSESCDGGTSGGSGSGSNHPSGNDRDTENGGSGDQGDSGSDPDGDENGGSDKPGEGGGANSGDQDGNNGSGNDTDFEDDNRGPDQDGWGTPGSNCS
jgi:prepilin-type N-terminal cleavage/methylation domain-containing protein